VATKFLGVRERFFGGFDRNVAPSKIVIHGTAGGGSGGKPGQPGGLLKWMMSGERETEYEAGIGLFHYLIERDNDVWEIIDPEKWVYHSGTGREIDSRTIGIELVNRDSSNMGDYTNGQYEALDTLIGELLNKYHIDEIVGHGAIYQRIRGKIKRLACPGPSFTWSWVGETLRTRGHGFSSGSQRYYDISMNGGNNG